MFSQILRRHSLRRRLTHFNEIGAIAEQYVNECVRLSQREGQALGYDNEPLSAMIIVIDDHRTGSSNDPSAPDPIERLIDFLIRRAVRPRILDGLDDLLC